MKLLQLILSHSRGGRELIPLQIASGFKTKGWKSAVAAPQGSFVASEARVRKLEVHSLPQPSRLDFGAPFRLASLLRREEPDILLLHFGRDAALWAWASLLLRRIPKTVFCVSVGSGVSKRDPYHRWIYSRLDWVTAISSVLYRNALQTLPVPKDRMNKITWGIETEKFRRARGPVRSSVRRVGTLARLSRGKGQDDLIRAWARVAEGHSQARLILAGGWGPGDEDYVSELKREVGRLGLASSVQFSGHIRNVPDYLGGLDAFVFPSRDEAYGVALVEAMAAGLPVLGAAASGVLEIIRPDRDGLLFKAGDAEDMAGQLARIMKGKALRARLGREARKRALENRSLERTVILYERLFKNLLAGTQASCALS